MNVYIERQKSTPSGTPGRLRTQHGWECDTLEPPWENNKPQLSCILPDSYNAEIWFSPSLQRNVVRLEDKHGRTNCLIHNANFAGTVDDPDTPDIEVSQVFGCTAVGEGYGEIEVPKKLAKRSGQKQWGIFNSSKTLAALLVELGPGHHTVTYSWAPGCEPADTTDALAPKPAADPAAAEANT